jgi:hypothetical protein
MTNNTIRLDRHGRLADTFQKKKNKILHFKERIKILLSIKQKQNYTKL